MNQVVLFNKAKQQLAMATDIYEVKEVRDRSQTLRQYVKQRGHSLPMQNLWAEITVRAERRAGELLREQEKHKGGRPTENWLHDATSLPKLKELGIEKTQSSRWQQIAKIPDEKFDEYISVMKEADKELTSKGLYDLAKLLKRVARFKERKEKPLPVGKYNVIYADPPWQYDNKLMRWGAAELHYKPKSTEEICRMNIATPDDAVLFLWVTNPFLGDGLVVVEAWGFEYKTNIVWVKKGLKRPGAGFYVRGRHELLFICTKGSFLPDQRAKEPIGSVIEAEVGKHSEKPEAFFELIEKMYPEGKYLQLFARRHRKGWESWGDEV